MTGQPSLLPIDSYPNHKEVMRLDALPANEDLPSASPDDGFVKDIALHGVLEPIQVATVEGKIVVLSGRRRIKAARSLGFETIPTLVYEDVPLDVVFGMISAVNNQRTDNPMADVEAILHFRNQGVTDERTLAIKTGMPLMTLRARMKLITLKDELRTAVKEGKMTMNAAEEAAKLPQERQDQLVTKMTDKKDHKLSVNDVREVRQTATKATVKAFTATLPTMPIPAVVRLFVKLDNSTGIPCIVGGPTTDKASLTDLPGEVYYLTKA